MTTNNTEDFQKEMILSKYISDLELLENGRDSILKSMAQSGIDDETVNKKLSKLNKSIDKLRTSIDEFKQTT